MMLRLPAITHVTRPLGPAPKFRNAPTSRRLRHVSESRAVVVLRRLSWHCAWEPYDDELTLSSPAASSVLTEISVLLLAVALVLTQTGGTAYVAAGTLQERALTSCRNKASDFSYKWQELRTGCHSCLLRGRFTSVAQTNPTRALVSLLRCCIYPSKRHGLAWP